MAHPDAVTPEVMERAGAQAAGRALEPHRESASFGLVERKQFDVANLSDAEFDFALERVALRQKRMARILETVLKVDVHYGTEHGIFKKPILKKAGQEELRNLFRLQTVHTAPPIIVESEEYVSVIVTVAVMDGAGRILAPHRGACNSREKRFKGRNGGWTYTDAREVMNDCLAMAEKRAGNRATMEVTGATAFLANEEEMSDALDAEAGEAPAPWTAAERAAFLAEAKECGLKGAEVPRFVGDVLGTTPDGKPRAVLQRDLPALVAALKARATGGVPPIKGEANGGGAS